MGPGGCQEPGRDQGLQGAVVADLQVAAVSSADIWAQPALPLNAAYWTTKQPGETYTAWRVRQECEDLERRATWHDSQAATLRTRATWLATGGQ
jgi:hypothetical protein